jgi:uncharacterized membrane protein YhaH (DUF805 family)
MNFFDAVKICFRKYGVFEGRATRPEYWYFVLFIFVVYLVLRFLSVPLSLLFDVGIIVPHLAVGARRLHDTDRSGWWLFIALVPLVGAIVLLVWFCQPGEVGDNRFGLPHRRRFARAEET